VGTVVVAGYPQSDSRRLSHAPWETRLTRR
jgi:hypothetical protein